MTAMASPSRSKLMIFRLLAMGIALVGSLLCAEVGVRFFYRNTSLFEHDGYTTKRFRPSRVLRHVDQESHLEVEIRTNRLGFRGPPIAATRPETRIALLGDSFVSQIQIPEEETVAGRLRATSLGGAKPEVLAMGIDGFNPAQELLVWQHYARDLEPDIVILELFPANDVREGSPTTSSGNQPYFHLVDGKLVKISQETRRKLSTWLNQNSKFYLWQKEKTKALVNRFKRWRAARRDRAKHEALAGQDPPAASSPGPTSASGNAEPPASVPAPASATAPGTGPATATAPAPASPPPPPPAALTSMLLRTDLIFRAYLPEDEPWRQSWAILEAIILEIRREVEAAGGRFLVVMIPHRYEVDPGRRQPLLARYPSFPEDYWDFERPRRRLLEIAGRNGLTLVDPTEPFSAALRAGTPVYFMDGHLTGEGSRIVTEGILEKLGK